MKKNILYCLFLLTMLDLACTNKPQKTTGITEIVDSIATQPIEETLPENGKEKRVSMSFAELIKRIPITPLPLGIEGIDTIMVYKSFNEPIEPLTYEPIAYDTLNAYGLNSFFFDHPEWNDELAGFGPVNGDHYFAKRLPRLKNGNEVLLYFVQQTSGECWELIICKPKTGEPINFDPYFMVRSDSRRYLGYIDEEYNQHSKIFTREEDQWAGLNLKNEFPAKEMAMDKSFLFMYNISNLNTGTTKYGRFFFWRKGQVIAYKEIPYKGKKEQLCIFIGTDTIPINSKGEPIEVK